VLGQWDLEVLMIFDFILLFICVTIFYDLCHYVGLTHFLNNKYILGVYSFNVSFGYFTSIVLWSIISIIIISTLYLYKIALNTSNIVFWN